MDLRNFTLDMMLEYLKNKGRLSDLERDILSSLEVLSMYPIDRKVVISKIDENKLKYVDILLQISLQPGVEFIPYQQLSDDELKNNLATQTQYMWIKEIQQISHC